jgi:hypothetical protein
MANERPDTEISGASVDGAAGADGASTDRERRIAEAAGRALAEAETRRLEAERLAAERSAETELGGRDGPEPTRYGDWEKKGIAIDF